MKSAVDSPEKHHLLYHGTWTAEDPTLISTVLQLQTSAHRHRQLLPTRFDPRTRPLDVQSNTLHVTIGLKDAAIRPVRSVCMLTKSERQWLRHLFRLSQEVGFLFLTSLIVVVRGPGLTISCNRTRSCRQKRVEPSPCLHQLATGAVTIN